jgi:hypothetical protein
MSENGNLKGQLDQTIETWWYALSRTRIMSGAQ